MELAEERAANEESDNERVKDRVISRCLFFSSCELRAVDRLSGDDDDCSKGARDNEEEENGPSRRGIGTSVSGTAEPLSVFDGEDE